MPVLTSSRRGSMQASRVPHRVNASLKSDAMTMWSVGKGYLTIRSVKSRDPSKVLKLKNPPKWTTEPAQTPTSPTTPSSEAVSPVVEKSEHTEPAASPSTGDDDDDDDDDMDKAGLDSEAGGSDMLAGLATDPGYGTMVLAPNTAPTFIVTGESVDLRTITGITPSVLLNRVHRGMDEMI